MRIYQLNPILEGDILGSQVLALDDSTQTRKISLDQIRKFLGVGENSTLIPSGTDIHAYFLTAKSGSYYGEGLINTAQGGAWAAFDWSTHEGERGTLIETNNVNELGVHSLAAGAWTKKKILSESDKTQSQADTTAGKLLKVGDFGLGGTPRQTTIGSELFASFWRDAVAGKSGITLPYDGSPTTNFLAIDAANHRAYVGKKIGTNEVEWVELYSEYNKPTPAEIGAYTKEESDAKFVKGIQLGARVAYDANKGDGQETHADAGHCLTGVSTTHANEGAGELINIYAKPIQRNINGVWATIPG